MASKQRLVDAVLQVFNFEDKQMSGEMVKLYRESFVKHIMYDLCLEDHPKTDPSYASNFLPSLVYCPLDEKGTSDEVRIYSSDKRLARRMITHKYGKSLSVIAAKAKNEGGWDHIGKPFSNMAYTSPRLSRVSPVYERPNEKSYRYNEVVKRENVHTEYKDCPRTDYACDMLDDVVAKYMSAFLNSDGGKLVIGVDNLVVKGVQYFGCSREDEDLLACVRRAAIFMDPPVQGNLYNVTFCQLCSADGSSPSRIMELCINNGVAGRMYASPSGNIYMKNQGNVQYVPDKHIYEVAKQMLEKEFEDDLKEMERKKEKAQKLLQKMVEEEKTIKKQVQEVSNEKKELVESLKLIHAEVNKIDQDLEECDRLNRGIGNRVRSEMDYMERFNRDIQKDVVMFDNEARRLVAVEEFRQNDEWAARVRALERQIEARMKMGWRNADFTPGGVSLYDCEM